MNSKLVVSLNRVKKISFTPVEGMYWVDSLADVPIRQVRWADDPGRFIILLKPFVIAAEENKRDFDVEKVWQECVVEKVGNWEITSVSEKNLKT